MHELVIFDCDGVLVDSEAISNEVLARMLTREGLPTTFAEARRACQGLLLTDVRDRAQAKLGRPFPPDWIAEYEHERNEAFHRELKAGKGRSRGGTACQGSRTEGLRCVSGSVDQDTIDARANRPARPVPARRAVLCLRRATPQARPRALSTCGRHNERQATSLRGHRGHPFGGHGCCRRRDAGCRLRSRQRRARPSQRWRRDRPLPGQLSKLLGLPE